MNKHLENYRTESFNGNKPPGIRSLTNESGSALIVALLIMAALITLVPVVMNQSTGEMDRAANFKQDREVFYLAEAGLEHGLSALKASDLKTILNGPDGDNTATADNGTVAGVGTPVTWNGNLYNEMSFGNGTYKFRVYDNNDEDGDLTTDADSLGFIESIGISADGTTKIMRALIHKIKLAMPPAAVTMVGPIAEIEVDHADFTVEGAFPGTMNGYAIDGTEDTTCAGKNGMAIEAPGPLEFKGDITETTDWDATPCTEASCIRFRMDSTGAEITGIGGGTVGNPDIVLGQTSLTSLDAAKLFRQLTVVETPDYSWSEYQPTTDVTFGSPTNPVVVYVSNELEVGSVTMTGYGILIVNEEVEVDAPGFLNWTGIVLFGVCPTCIPDEFEMEADNALIYGSVIVGGEEIEFEEAGTIRYSCEAIAIANGVFNNVFSVIAWEEIT